MTIDLQILLDYADGGLPAGERERVERHLATAPDARATVALYRSVRDATAADDGIDAPPEAVRWAMSIFRTKQREDRAPSVLGRLGAVIATLIDDSALIPVPLRSASGTARQLLFQSEDVEIDLEVACAPEGEDRWRIIGQVSGAGAASARIVAVPDGATQPIAEARADDAGMFRLEVPAAPLDLCVELPGRIISLPGIAPHHE